MNGMDSSNESAATSSSTTESSPPAKNPHRRVKVYKSIKIYKLNKSFWVEMITCILLYSNLEHGLPIGVYVK